ncbi:MAG: SIMPL domain-containing protein [Victivallaceae bacterium]|nr:SIMPL domain-containing protein [Victivallaceae bacterium]
MFNKTIVVCAGIIGVAAIASALLLSNLKINFKDGSDTINVIGLASRKVPADRAEFSFTVTVNSKNISAGYARLEAECAKARNLMYGAGFKADELSSSPITLMPTFVRDRNGFDTAEIRFFVLSRTVDVSTANLPLADYGSQLPQQLMAEGAEVSVSSIHYTCSEPRQCYDELLAAAGADAKTKAERIAASGGFRVGKLLKAEPPRSVSIDSGNGAELVVSLALYADYSVK